MANSDVESLSAKLASLNRSAASKFMSIVPDDVLEEILLRLPDARAVVRSAAVCDRWRRLAATPRFVKSYIRQKQKQKESLESSTLFKYEYNNEALFYQLPLKEWRFESEPYDLSFMPDSDGVGIVAADGDLLLLARGLRQFYLCNSLTRHWLALPEIPPVEDFDPIYKHSFFRVGNYGYALARDPRGGDGFRAVVVHQARFTPPVDYSFRAAVFDSEAGAWTLPLLRARRSSPDRCLRYALPLEMASAGDGTLYWLDGDDSFDCLVAFDPFASEVRLIDLPVDPPLAAVNPYDAKDRVRLGVVAGRLRLSRILKLGDNCFGLKVWELDSSDAWLSVLDAALNPPGAAAIDKMFFVLSFDPIDSNVVFIVCNREIFRYDIDRDSYERVCHFPCCGKSIDRVKENVAGYLKVLTNVQPFWPTPIPRDV